MTEFAGFLAGVNKQRFLENLLEEKMLATERYATKWAAYIACLSHGILIPEVLKDCLKGFIEESKYLGLLCLQYGVLAKDSAHVDLAFVLDSEVKWPGHFEFRYLIRVLPEPGADTKYIKEVDYNPKLINNLNGILDEMRRDLGGIGLA